MQRTTIQLIGILLCCEMRWLAWLATRFFPTQPEFFGSFDYTIVQSLGVVARKKQLYGREESRNITILLVTNILANTFVGRDCATFEFDYGKSNTIDIYDQIGAPVAFALNGYLLGYLKIILHRVGPVDKVYHLFLFCHLGLYIHAITQQGIDLLVGIIQSATEGVCRLLEFGNGTPYLLVRIATPREICCKQLFFDISITLTSLPVPEIGVL